MKHQKNKHRYNIHRLGGQTHLRVMADKMSREGEFGTLYVGDGYDREQVWVGKLENIEGIRRLTKWGKLKKKKKKKKKKK